MPTSYQLNFHLPICGIWGYDCIHAWVSVSTRISCLWGELRMLVDNNFSCNPYIFRLWGIASD